MKWPQLAAACEALRALQKKDRGRDMSAWIEEKLTEMPSAEEAAVLRVELVCEYRRHQRYKDAAAVLEAEIEREPNEPYPSLSLAEHFYYYDVDLERSLAHIADAVSKARTIGKFVYQALGVQARLCIATRDWRLLESTLIQLTLHEHTPGRADVFPETDFIARIPPDVVSQDIVKAFVDRVDYLRSVKFSTMSAADDISKY